MPDTLTLVRPTIIPHEALQADWDVQSTALSADAWIGLYPGTAGGSSWVRWCYLDGRSDAPPAAPLPNPSTAPVALRTYDAPGAYTVRLFADGTLASEVAHADLTIEDPSATTIPTIAGDEQVSVLQWNISNNLSNAQLDEVAVLITGSNADVVALLECSDADAVYLEGVLMGTWYRWTWNDWYTLFSRHPEAASPLPGGAFQPAVTNQPVVGTALTTTGGVTFVALLGKLSPAFYGPEECRYFDLHVHDEDDILRNERPLRRAQLVRAMGRIGLDGTTPAVLALGTNSPSHLDWDVGREFQNWNLVVPWPTTIAIAAAGFTDTYRDGQTADDAPGFTWPASTTSGAWSADRIDMIYARGGDTHAVAVVDSVLLGPPTLTALGGGTWPSDHRAVLTILEFTPSV